MNEILFFTHILFVVGFAFLSLRFGKETLVAIVALQGVLANLFVTKQMSLFGLNVTCSDVFIVGCILCLNLLQEYYGKDSARLASKISLITNVFFALMSKMHLAYTPLSFDPFIEVLDATPRIVFASIGVFYLVQQIDLRLFSYLKGIFALRVAISLIISQFIDTVLFSFLGLYGLVASIGDVIVMSYVIKCLVIATSSFLVMFSKRFVKDVSF